MPEDELMDAREVARLLKVNYRTVLKLVESGEVPALRVRGLWRFKRTDVDTYIEEQKRRQQQHE